MNLIDRIFDRLRARYRQPTDDFVLLPEDYDPPVRELEDGWAWYCCSGCHGCSGAPVERGFSTWEAAKAAQTEWLSR